MLLMFLLVMAAIAVWWLLARRLVARPWESTQRLADDRYDGGLLAMPPARIGLWALLAVITSLFTLFMSAYSMRMMLADWVPLSDPAILWVNTAMLILSSLAFQWTQGATARGDANAVSSGLVVAGFFAFAFLGGQLLAWRQLNASGAFLYSNAANAFFYLLTALHGVHVLGGLIVWARTAVRLWRGNSEIGQIRQSVELCTIYWHYLLLVWVVLFGLLLTT